MSEEKVDCEGTPPPPPVPLATLDVRAFALRVDEGKREGALSLLLVGPGAAPPPVVTLPVRALAFPREKEGSLAGLPVVEEERGDVKPKVLLLLLLLLLPLLLLVTVGEDASLVEEKEEEGFLRGGRRCKGARGLPSLPPPPPLSKGFKGEKAEATLPLSPPLEGNEGVD